MHLIAIVVVLCLAIWAGGIALRLLGWVLYSGLKLVALAIVLFAAFVLVGCTNPMLDFQVKQVHQFCFDNGYGDRVEHDALGRPVAVECYNAKLPPEESPR